jgi:hypothetical protein
VENRFEVFLDVFSPSPDITAGNSIEGFLCHLCDTFSRECLSRPRTAVQEDDQAVTLPTNQICRFFGCELICDQGLNELLGLWIDDETLKRFLVPRDFADMVDDKVLWS